MLKSRRLHPADQSGEDGTLVVGEELGADWHVEHSAAQVVGNITAVADALVVLFRGDDECGRVGSGERADGRDV